MNSLCNVCNDYINEEFTAYFCEQNKKQRQQEFTHLHLKFLKLFNKSSLPNLLNKKRDAIIGKQLLYRVQHYYIVNLSVIQCIGKPCDLLYFRHRRLLRFDAEAFDEHRPLQRFLERLSPSSHS